MGIHSVKDQLGNTINVPALPKRIISLVPSQTELLYDLGLNNEVVGITKFCVHPDTWFRTKNKVGGTKKINLERIAELKPDLIIGNKEENTKGEIETLQQHYPVWMSDIYTLEDAKKTILDIGNLVGRAPEASYLYHLVHAGFNDLKVLSATMPHRGKRVLYLIWRNPYMAVGGNTFVHDILNTIGFENAVNEQRYPEISPDAIAALTPDYVFLSSEPYPFKEKHMLELQRLAPQAKIVLVDGEMFSWYGSRLVKAVQYFFEFNTLIG